MWFANGGLSPGEHYQYAESTDGVGWYAFSEGTYCPPSAKTNVYKIMAKPSVLYRPGGGTTISTANPMDNRYVMYLNSGEDEEPYYYELYISSNGLNWRLYARDTYCQARYPGQSADDIVTFSGYTASGKAYPDYLDTFERVYLNSAPRAG